MLYVLFEITPLVDESDSPIVLTKVQDRCRYAMYRRGTETIGSHRCLFHSSIVSLNCWDYANLTSVTSESNPEIKGSYVSVNTRSANRPIGP